jgi:hypothetical protein
LIGTGAASKSVKLPVGRFWFALRWSSSCFCASLPLVNSSGWGRPTGWFCGLARA